jgi:hypothetical protein
MAGGSFNPLPATVPAARTKSSRVYLSFLHLRLDNGDDFPRDVVLNLEDLVEVAVKLVGPEMMVARCTDLPKVV